MSRLRDLRCERLMTQAQLARKAKVSLRTVTGIERGFCRARMATRRALLAAFGLPLELHGKVFGPMPDYPGRPRRAS